MQNGSQNAAHSRHAPVPGKDFYGDPTELCPRCGRRVPTTALLEHIAYCIYLDYDSSGARGDCCDYCYECLNAVLPDLRGRKYHDKCWTIMAYGLQSQSTLLNG